MLCRYPWIRSLSPSLSRAIVDWTTNPRAAREDVDLAPVKHFRRNMLAFLAELAPHEHTYFEGWVG